METPDLFPVRPVPQTFRSFRFVLNDVVRLTCSLVFQTMAEFAPVCHPLFSFLVPVKKLSWNFAFCVLGNVDAARTAP